MSNGAGQNSKGLNALFDRPLLEAIWRRRTHRGSRGVAELKAGSMSYTSSQKPVPLTELEEAVLIAVTGHTGLTMPDRPFQDPQSGDFIMAKPNLTMDGRTAGSPDNAQGTYFFMINDTGTYFIKKLPSVDPGVALTPDTLIAQARQAKIKVLDRRLDTSDRDFPAYLDSNRFLSNLPGTTIFFPVVDLSQQYINGLMYLLTQPKGHRPTFVDDRNFYRKAGVAKWVRKGFLNPDIKIPLGVAGTLRTHIEADLLLQNLVLVADSMGLGAYIHASISPPVLLGDPKFTDQYGKMLGFDFATPPFKLLDRLNASNATTRPNTAVGSVSPSPSSAFYRPSVSTAVTTRNTNALSGCSVCCEFALTTSRLVVPAAEVRILCNDDCPAPDEFIVVATDFELADLGLAIAGRMSRGAPAVNWVATF
jgi:hypothetical protein